LKKDDGRIGMCRSTVLLIDNITLYKRQRQSIGKRYQIECFTILLFGVYNGLS